MLYPLVFKSISMDAKLKNLNFYKLFSNNGSWLLLSFRHPDPVVADNILRLFIRCGVVWKRISEVESLNHSLRFFSRFRVGALLFSVGHRDHIRYSDFFFKNLVERYEWDYSPLEGLHSGIVLSSSPKEEDLRHFDS